MRLPCAVAVLSWCALQALAQEDPFETMVTILEARRAEIAQVQAFTVLRMAATAQRRIDGGFVDPECAQERGIAERFPEVVVPPTVSSFHVTFHPGPPQSVPIAGGCRVTAFAYLAIPSVTTPGLRAFCVDHHRTVRAGPRDASVRPTDGRCPESWPVVELPPRVPQPTLSESQRRRLLAALDHDPRAARLDAPTQDVIRQLANRIVPDSPVAGATPAAGGEELSPGEDLPASGWIGLEVLAVTGEEALPYLALEIPNPVTVVGVQPGGPAQEAGLRPGDVIAAVDGALVASQADAARRLSQAAPSQWIGLLVVRSIEVRLGARPDGSAWLGIDLQSAAAREAAPGLTALGDRMLVIVAAVNEGGPAAQAGLEPEDAVIGAGGRRITTQEQLVQVLGVLRASDPLRLVVARSMSIAVRRRPPFVL